MFEIFLIIVLIYLTLIKWEDSTPPQKEVTPITFNANDFKAWENDLR